MVKLDVSRAIARQCAKPHCSRPNVQRHHKGSEAMWIRHFRHKKGRPKYDAFVARYHEFHPKDCVALCDWHHTEIHMLYKQHISVAVRTLDYRPCRTWNWKEAEDLMNRLRGVCDFWLTQVTPGIEPAPRTSEIHNELPSQCSSPSPTSESSSDSAANLTQTKFEN